VSYSIRAYIPPADPIPVEKIDAADIVLAARRAATLAQNMSHEEREVWAKRLEYLIQELHVGVIVFRKGAPDPTFIPDFLKPDGPPLPDRVYLRAAADALIHE
jgi:hypothetical protein